MARGARRSSAEIPEGELIRLYCDAGLSMEVVARQLGWSMSAVRARLVALGIPRRAAWARNAVDCDPGELSRLYVEQGLSLSALATRYGCALTTIWRKLQAAGIACREGGSEPKYARTDFSGDLSEKAYLLGFRIGDLNVAAEGSRTIVVKCTSTRAEQIELFKALFEPYGHVYTDSARKPTWGRHSVGMEARLNRTFDYLLPKQDAVPGWVREGSDEVFFAFLAGYIDAEGYFHTYVRRGQPKPSACLEVRSYDAVLLTQLQIGLRERGIECPIARLRVRAGYTNREGVLSNRDLWGLGIHRKESLRRLFTRIDPYLRHSRRRRDMLTALATC